jgi:hypothetical protein
VSRCRSKLRFPVEERGSARIKQTQFSAHIDNVTKAIDGDEKQKYLGQRWPRAS